jgi:rhamnulokinase
VLVGRFGAAPATLEEVHRFPNEPVRVSGRLHWDALRLFRGVLDGLGRAEENYGPLDSVGVDGWAVDYGLLDGFGRLIGNPVHYRDERTVPEVEKVLAETGPEYLYAATGCQLQPFNTVFQLLAERRGDVLAIARDALLVPDLINYWLCGVRGTELTNASTTGLLDVRTRTWSVELAERLGVSAGLFPPLHTPGTVLGSVLPDVLADAHLTGAPQVIAVPSHDTAAAVAGVPADRETFAYVSTGTWALVGVELPTPVITDDGRAANFTNEIGADGTIRYLRNVTGFWLLQECMRTWTAEGHRIDLDELTSAATAVPSLQAVVDVQDARFAAPGEMPTRIADAAVGSSPSTPAEIARCVLDSMALAIRVALRDAVRLTARQVDIVHVVGGGVANRLFCQLVADACGLPVLAGPSEAASWGNAVAQAQALGAVGRSLAAARDVVREAVDPEAYPPRGTDADWRAAEAALAPTVR